MGETIVTAEHKKIVDVDDQDERPANSSVCGNMVKQISCSRAPCPSSRQLIGTKIIHAVFPISRLLLVPMKVVSGIAPPPMQI